MCASTGIWFYNGVCEARVCQFPATPSHATTPVCPEGTTCYSACSYGCETGFTAAGGKELSLFCEPNGTWTIGGSCVEVDCGFPSTPSHATQPTCPSGTKYGAVCRFGCVAGYTISPANTLTCGANGRWYQDDFCDVVNCGQPSTPLTANAPVCPTGTTYGDICTFSCRDPFVGGGNLTCGPTALWQQSGECFLFEPVTEFPLSRDL